MVLPRGSYYDGGACVMSLLEKLVDFYYVTIRGQHKHNYIRSGEEGYLPKDAKAGDVQAVSLPVSWKTYKCTDCKKLITVYDRNKKNIPYYNKYEPLPSK